MPQPNTNAELRIVAEFYAKPGQADALRTVLTGLVAPSRAEPGCLLYELNEDIHEPGHFIFYERWKDLAAIEAHTRMPHSLAAGPMIEPLVAAPGTVTRIAQIA